MLSRNRIVEDAAREQGFVLVGFAPLRPLSFREEFYRRWLAQGRHHEMEYLARSPERRIDPRLIDRRLGWVVSLGFPYAAPRLPRIDWRRELRGRIASYALGRDYHHRLLKRVRAVARAITGIRPDATCRVYVDTGPVFEREWARESQIGWVGKNTMLLNREIGSYSFLAEILTDVEFDPSVPPYGEYCGTCRRCLDLCPTGALKEGYLMEPGLCISYLTIEHRGPIPIELRPKIGNWIFGCDICQQVCPWNESTDEEPQWELVPYLPDLMALEQPAFSHRFKGSAVKRTRRRGLLRNVAVALGNSGNPAAVGVLSRVIETEPDSLVRRHAAWALGRLGGIRARRALEAAHRRETDEGVLGEVRLALEAAASRALVKGAG